MSTKLSVLLFVSIIVGAQAVGFTFEAIDDSSDTDSGDSNAGNFVGFQRIKNTEVDLGFVATGNDATSNSGISNSGNRVFQNGDESTVNSDLTFDITSNNNNATSGTNDAVSGGQFVFSTARGPETNINFVKNTEDNTATVTEEDSDPDTNADAIAGEQFQQFALLRGASNNQTSFTADNTATNYLGGKSIAGTSNNLDRVRTGSSLFLNSNSDGNNATNLDGKAIAGKEDNIRSTVGSEIEIGGVQQNNSATATNGDAVSGAQNNFLRVVRNDNTSITTDDKAYNNDAVATDGKAISGTQTNIRKVKLTDVEINGVAKGNNATVYGDSVLPQDAVSGNDVQIKILDEADLTVNLTASNNEARNFHSAEGSDAIAGNNVFVGRSRNNPSIDATLDAKNNYAYSANGDAIAGNRILVLDNTSLSSTVNAVNNTAVAPNGDAVIYSETNVGK